MQSFSDRDALIDRFLAAQGWGGAKRVRLAGDASARRYERILREEERCVLMDAPPESEDVRPFLHVAMHLQGCKMSAPRILGSDAARGFLLLEDLGDDLYTRVLERHPEREEALYLAAADVLVELYRTADRARAGDFTPYDTHVLLRECALFSDWFLPAVADAQTARRLGEDYMALWRGLLAHLPQDQGVLVLRDYHADNLLYLEGREGIARVGLLDFQDALIGHPAYDMVSFLEDARRDVSAATVSSVTRHYLEQVPVDRDAFLAAYALLGAQRNCKIIGIFLRLCLRDGKRQYLSYLPRVWRHLETDMRHPALLPLARWMQAHVPPEWRIPAIQASA